MELILKISVRMALKIYDVKLWCTSFFDIISDSEEGGILFLQIVVMFEMKKKNESKIKHWVIKFFRKREEKEPFNNLTRNETSR